LAKKLGFVTELWCAEEGNLNVDQIIEYQGLAWAHKQLAELDKSISITSRSVEFVH